MLERVFVQRKMELLYFEACTTVEVLFFLRIDLFDYYDDDIPVSFSAE